MSDKELYLFVIKQIEKYRNETEREISLFESFDKDYEEMKYNSNVAKTWNWDCCMIVN